MTSENIEQKTADLAEEPETPRDNEGAPADTDQYDLEYEEDDYDEEPEYGQPYSSDNPGWWAKGMFQGVPTLPALAGPTR